VERREASALDKIVPQVYAELHRLAHRYLWHERAGHTLQTSDLIHEAYLRLKYRSARISRFSLASPLP
jgi:hypothetical protein